MRVRGGSHDRRAGHRRRSVLMAPPCSTPFTRATHLGDLHITATRSPITCHPATITVMGQLNGHSMGQRSLEHYRPVIG